jgi:hypothetical protein
MAFQRRQGGGGGKNAPTLSVKLSVKQGQEYIQGPSFGFWPNDQGGPAFRGKLSDDRLAEVLDFLSTAYESGLPVSMAMFDNAGQRPAAAKPAFRKPAFQKPAGGASKFGSGGFRKPAAGEFNRKPNPFKPVEEQEQQEGEEPRFDDTHDRN